jgi:VIT1/CCC1 family predicted Fe2+/Mn2+ transporter
MAAPVYIFERSAPRHSGRAFGGTAPNPMSESHDTKPSRKAYARAMAAAFTFGGIGICRVEAPAFFSNSSLGRFALICLLGAALALLGYGVGSLIDRAKQ